MALRARRSHSHVRERERVCTRADPQFFRTERFIMYMMITHFQHLAHCLATTHTQIPVYTGGMAHTQYLPVYPEDDFSVLGIAAVMDSGRIGHW